MFSFSHSGDKFARSVLVCQRLPVWRLGLPVWSFGGTPSVRTYSILTLPHFRQILTFTAASPRRTAAPLQLLRSPRARRQHYGRSRAGSSAGAHIGARPPAELRRLIHPHRHHLLPPRAQASSIRSRFASRSATCQADRWPVPPQHASSRRSQGRAARHVQIRAQGAPTPSVPSCTT